jgi:hypothetical protein
MLFKKKLKVSLSLRFAKNILLVNDLDRYFLIKILHQLGGFSLLQRGHNVIGHFKSGKAKSKEEEEGM